MNRVSNISGIRRDYANQDSLAEAGEKESSRDELLLYLSSELGVETGILARCFPYHSSNKNIHYFLTPQAVKGIRNIFGLEASDVEMPYRYLSLIQSTGESGFEFKPYGLDEYQILLVHLVNRPDLLEDDNDLEGLLPTYAVDEANLAIYGPYLRTFTEETSTDTTNLAPCLWIDQQFRWEFSRENAFNSSYRDSPYFNSHGIDLDAVQALLERMESRRFST